MKFIVLEGLDGAGKSTQIKLLKNWFKENNLSVEYLHFPRTESPFYGEMIAKFLRGDFGKLEEVNPYIVALLYAGDRKDASSFIENKLKSGTYILVDRYVYSNIAYQCAKIDDTEERNKLKNWILNFEYNYNKIVKPDYSFFLDVPFDFTKKSLENNREGEDREYLKGKKDIHEENLNFQLKVRDVYEDLLNTEKDFFKINCFNDEKKMMSPDKIFEQIKTILDKTLL